MIANLHCIFYAAAKVLSSSFQYVLTATSFGRGQNSMALSGKNTQGVLECWSVGVWGESPKEYQFSLFFLLHYSITLLLQKPFEIAGTTNPLWGWLKARFSLRPVGPMGSEPGRRFFTFAVLS